MIRERILRNVAVLHAAFVVALAFLSSWGGRPVSGVLVGGSLIGIAYVLLWGIIRSIVRGERRGTLFVLGTLKVAFYLGLVAAGMTGVLRLEDPLGFAGGVTCFVAAILAAAAWNQGEAFGEGVEAI